MIKFSILEKSRAPSRIAFCEGLGSGDLHPMLVVVVGQVCLDIRLFAHEAKGDLGVEGRSHFLGQLPDQFDMLSAVRLENPVLFAGTARAVAEPDRSEKRPSRLSFDEAEQVFPWLRIGVLAQDTERITLRQRVLGEASRRGEIESLREKKPPDFDRKGFLIVNEFHFVVHCLFLSRYSLTASNHRGLIDDNPSLYSPICQGQQKIATSGVSSFVTPRIKKFSSPQN